MASHDGRTDTDEGVGVACVEHTDDQTRSRSPQFSRSPSRRAGSRSPARRQADSRSRSPVRRSASHGSPNYRRRYDRGTSDHVPPSRMMDSVRENSQQNRRVYVGNLSYEVRWYQLKDYMRKAGEILFADVLTLPNGLSKNVLTCRAVEYAREEDARRAIAELSDSEFMGRLVFVREDRESAPRFSGVPSATVRDRHDVGTVKFPGRQLFVGNLPFHTSWQGLKDLFRQADINIGHDGRSKGSGIVAFGTFEEAQYAIERLNGYNLDGRHIEVREDRFVGSSRTAGVRDYGAIPNTFKHIEVGPNPFTDHAIGGGVPSDTIHVDNLPWATTNEDLMELFESITKVVRAEIASERSGRSRGFGVVQLESPTAAQTAITRFQGYVYGGRPLCLSFVQYMKLDIPVGAEVKPATTVFPITVVPTTVVPAIQTAMQQQQQQQQQAGQTNGMMEGVLPTGL